MELSLDNAPAWASISASGVLSVAPTAPLGAQALTIRATDGASTATKQVIVTVAPRQLGTQLAELARPAKSKLGISFKSRVSDGGSLIRALSALFEITALRVEQVEAAAELKIECLRLDVNPSTPLTGPSPSSISASGYTWAIRYFSGGDLVSTWAQASSLEAELAYGAGGAQPQPGDVGCATGSTASVKAALDLVLVPPTRLPACYGGAGILYNGGDGVVVALSKQ